MTVRTARYDAPFGALTLVVSDDALIDVVLPGQDTRARALRTDDAGGDDLLAAVAAQLDGYFAGDRHEFDLPLGFGGASSFDRAVYRAMRDIPFGEVASYGQVAEDAHHPGSARAVGGACNRNRLPIVVPCHRVVAADGTLGGYGAGLGIKRDLLAHERGGDVPRGGWGAS